MGNKDFGIYGTANKITSEKNVHATKKKQSGKNRRKLKCGGMWVETRGLGGGVGKCCSVIHLPHENRHVSHKSGHSREKENRNHQQYK